MKLADKFPDAKHGQMLKLPGESVLCIQDAAVCFYCGAESYFASFAFEAAVCSTECLDAAWKEVFTPPAAGDDGREGDPS